MAAEIYSSIKPAVFIKVWEGYDRPDVGNLTADPDTPAGQKLLRMVGEGVGGIFAASYKDIENGETRDSFSTPVDGPIPEFYEPVESPTNVVRVFASIGAAVRLPATSLGSMNLSRNRLSKYWGFKGLSTEPSGNYITIDALDPNAQSQEFKACLIDIRKAWFIILSFACPKESMQRKGHLEGAFSRHGSNVATTRNLVLPVDFAKSHAINFI